MMTSFSNQIKSFAASVKASEKTRQDFLRLLASGKYLRGEGSEEHFGVYFLPYNPKTKQVFLIHHEKAELWLSPGGHIDNGETPLETLRREVREELGIEINPNENTQPFFLSTVEITPKPQRRGCRKHYDIWFLIETDGGDFEVDPREFLESRWVTINEARGLVTDPSTLEALDIIESMP